MTDYAKHEVALRYWLHGKGFLRAIKAMNIAQTVHCGLRKDGVTPAHYHQTQIASYLRTLQLVNPEETLVEAFLHDTVEDDLLTVEWIEKNFGATTARNINLLNKKNAHSTAYYYTFLGDHLETSIVKGADRINNQDTMSGVFSLEKQKEYIHETEQYVLPMLKSARRKFPEQESAYENCKVVLQSQINFVRAMQESHDQK